MYVIEIGKGTKHHGGLAYSLRIRVSKLEAVYVIRRVTFMKLQ